MVVITIDKNLIFEFDIMKKISVFDDKDAYFCYTYSGIVQFVDNKVRVTFTEGDCHFFVYGGSGVDSYYDTATFRNADYSTIDLNQEKM